MALSFGPPENIQDPQTMGWLRNLYNWISSQEGSSGINYLQSGTGSSTRTVEDKLRERLDTRDFGVVGNGTTDDIISINKALTYAKSIGGADIYLMGSSGNKFLISSTIQIVSSNIRLIGMGSMSGCGGAVQTDTSGAHSTLLWGGGAGSMVLVATPITSGTSAYKISGNMVSNIFMNGTGVATAGLEIRSIFKGVLNDLHVEGIAAGGKAYWTHCMEQNQGLFVTDVQSCEFSNLTAYLSTSANALYLDGESNPLYGGDTSGNIFKNLNFMSNTGTSIVVNNADTNFFYNIFCYHYGSSPPYNCLELKRGNNFFYTLASDDDIYLLGTTSGNPLGGPIGGLINFITTPTTGGEIIADADASVPIINGIGGIRVPTLDVAVYNAGTTKFGVDATGYISADLPIYANNAAAYAAIGAGKLYRKNDTEDAVYVSHV